MRSAVAVMILCCCLGTWAQQQPSSDETSGQDHSASSDRKKARARDAEAGESSSRDTQIDTSPPKDDAKNHPGSNAAVSEAEGNVAAASDVQELHPWNPYRAVKDNEVGEFYFKQKNYKAALARYQDALEWKHNDAVASFRIAQCYEKLGQPEEAVLHYQEYLKILPQGPFSKEARKALQKLQAAENQGSEKSPKP